MATSVTLSGVAEYPEMVASKAQKMLVMANLRAPTVQSTEERIPVAICAVIDRSGSMKGGKLDLIVQSLQFVVRELTPKDQLAIIAYDHNVTTTMEMSFMTKDNQQLAMKALQKLRPGGSTFLSGGLFAGLATMLALDKNKDESPIDPKPTPEPVPIPKPVPTPKPRDRPTRPIDEDFLLKGVKSDNTKDKPTPTPVEDEPELRMSGFQISPEPDVTSPAPSAPPAPEDEDWVDVTAREDSKREEETAETVKHVDPIEEVVKPPKKQLQKSVWLFTDGQANKGLRTIDDMLAEYYKIMGEGESDNSLYTFGFGNSHNDDLLKALAEAGGGMYYFIEKAGDIPEAFAECLGGLLTVAATILQLKVTPMDGIEVTNVVSEESVKDPVSKAISFSMKNLYSEEERDFVIEVQLPVTSVTRSQVLVKLELTYNDVTGEEQTDDCMVSIARIEKAPEKPQVPNEAVDKQRNRLEVQHAVKRAKVACDSGRYDSARVHLQAVQQKVGASTSARDAYCQDLVDDLQNVEALCTSSAWSNTGTKVANNIEMGHRKQRACGMKKAMYKSEAQEGLMAKMKAAVRK